MLLALQGFHRSVNTNRLPAKETHQTVAATACCKDAGVSHEILASRDNLDKILQPSLAVKMKTMHIFFQYQWKNNPVSLHTVEIQLTKTTISICPVNESRQMWEKPIQCITSAKTEKSLCDVIEGTDAWWLGRGKQGAGFWELREISAGCCSNDVWDEK